MSFTVLSYGHDSLLLETRELILNHDGFRVVTASDTTEACSILADQTVDLLLLCHTLSEQEFQSILAAAHARQPPPRVLTLGADTFTPPSAAADSVFDSRNGPGRLLAAIHGLIENRGSEVASPDR